MNRHRCLILKSIAAPILINFLGLPADTCSNSNMSLKIVIRNISLHLLEAGRKSYRLNWKSAWFRNWCYSL